MPSDAKAQQGERIIFEGWAILNNLGNPARDLDGGSKLDGFVLWSHAEAYLKHRRKELAVINGPGLRIARVRTVEVLDKEQG